MKSCPGLCSSEACIALPTRSSFRQMVEEVETSTWSTRQRLKEHSTFPGLRITTYHGHLAAELLCGSLTEPSCHWHPQRGPTEPQAGAALWSLKLLPGLLLGGGQEACRKRSPASGPSDGCGLPEQEGGRTLTAQGLPDPALPTKEQAHRAPHPPLSLPRCVTMGKAMPLSVPSFSTGETCKKCRTCRKM